MASRRAKEIFDHLLGMVGGLVNLLLNWWFHIKGIGRAIFRKGE